MLKDFFSLDGEFIVFKGLNDLEDHFKTSSFLENTLFSLIVLPPCRTIFLSGEHLITSALQKRRSRN